MGFQTCQMWLRQFESGFERRMVLGFAQLNKYYLQDVSPSKRRHVRIAHD